MVLFPITQKQLNIRIAAKKKKIEPKEQGPSLHRKTKLVKTKLVNC